MYEQDVIARMIRDAVRVVMKVLFGKEHAEEEKDGFAGSDSGSTVANALLLADAGRLTEAENELYAHLNPENREDFRSAMLFYGYVNEKSDEILAKDGWTRERIRSGMLRAAALYGMESLVGMLL